VNKVVMVDATGVLKWIDRDSLGNAGGFVECSDMSGDANLSANSKVNLNNNNLYFENNDALGLNHIGIGYDCSNTLSAKLSVQQVHPSIVNTSTTALSAINNDIGNTQGSVFTGIEGKALATQTALQIINRGSYFTAENAGHVRGVVSEIPAFSTYCFTAYGGEFNVSSDARDNYGVIANSTGDGPQTENKAIVGYAKNSKIHNIGGYFNANSLGTISGRSIGVDAVAEFSDQLNIGGSFKSICNITATGVSIGVSGIAFEGGYSSNTYPGSTFIGVYGAALPTSLGNPSLYAGYFDGDVYINGPTSGTGYALTSDILFKTDTATISSSVADSLLLLLKPKSYYMDTLNNYGMNFSSKKQFGLVAQDVENVIPNIVNENHKPAMIDTMGNVIIQGVDYKTLNYTELIPLLIAGHQEQSSKIDSLQTANDSLQTQITDLNNRLSQLENCLSGILPFLCQLSQNAIEENGKVAQEELRHIIEVELHNGASIVLNQNVPNPFAEKTVITYTIPQSVQEAQIVFYDATGSLIKTIDIRERGNGQINVYAQDLSSGTYTYSLVADGKVVATKRMVKAGF
ncbi:MAG TPA: tail fiber domain-containing protein, partial [Taishania sp.]|nr:tail fiber domain-containing protein [Taishania sp.]